MQFGQNSKGERKRKLFTLHREFHVTKGKKVTKKANFKITLLSTLHNRTRNNIPRLLWIKVCIKQTSMSNQETRNQEIRLNPSLSSFKKKRSSFFHWWIGNKCAQRNRFFHMGEENSSRTWKDVSLSTCFFCLHVIKVNCVKWVTNITVSWVQTFIFCSLAVQRVAS